MQQWVTYNWYRIVYLHGTTPLITDENSFNRWAENAIIKINRRNLEFANETDYKTLMSAMKVIELLTDVESTIADDIAVFIQELLDSKEITAVIEVTEENGIYTLTVTANALFTVYEFELNGTIIESLECVSKDEFELADIPIKRTVCAIAEILAGYSANTSGREGLRSESNFSYSWTANNSDEQKKELQSKIKETIRDNLAQTKWRDYFYFWGNSLYS